jgi:pepF/M3 family oligoendopeptidase
MEPTQLENLPRWKTDNIYSSLEGADYRAAFDELGQRIDSLTAWFDEHGVRRLIAPPTVDARALALSMERALNELNDVALRYGQLDSFIHAFVTTNSYDAVAAREASRLELLGTKRQKLDVRFQGWVGSIGDSLDDLVAKNGGLEKHAFYLRETARQSRFLMSEELESLAADLCLDGGVAFGKLQGNVTSQLKVPFERDGKVELLPITVIRNLSFDPDRNLRERAYKTEIEGWNSIRTSIAACMNGVKGTAQTLAKRRGRESVLDVALDDNRINRATLDAMLGAIREALPMFRGYLQAKAAKLGMPRLAWWDIFAPLGSSHKTFSWSEARQFIINKFATFDADMSGFARQAFDENWIDVGPRDGKRGGAFCMEVLGVDESRILMNFDGSFDQVSTLAHELGHGYHNHCQRGLEPLRRGSPMALAETASIFCETLVAEAALAEASRDEQVSILETQLCGATQVCVDILSRFIFESAVFERRGRSELSPDELCDLIVDAQRQTYADAIEPDSYHRYMWLWKPHYYSYTSNFYNFPYAFGHLFSLGLYAIFRRDGASFVPRYQELLSSTNLDYAAPLAARFGIDITKADFWRSSLQIIAEQAQRFETL